MTDIRSQVRGWTLFAGTDASTTASNGGVIASAVRGSAGVYTVTLTPGADALFCSVYPIIRAGAANANIQLTWTSDTALAVTTFVGTVATDENFELTITSQRAAA